MAYHQEYDDQLHHTFPTSPECLLALQHHVESFARLAEAARDGWGPQPHAILFAPDHGGHIDPQTGRGTHGLDIPEDMQVEHFWGFYGSGGDS